MLEILQFIFSDWLHFFGTLLLISCIGSVAEDVIRAFTKRK